MTSARNEPPLADPHLRAALAHAPDRDTAGPPASLSARIRAEALRVSAPPRPGWRQRLMAAIDLVQRPAIGAAFASLVLGTAIVLIWRDTDIPAVVKPGAPETPAIAAQRGPGMTPSIRRAEPAPAPQTAASARNADTDGLAQRHEAPAQAGAPEAALATARARQSRMADAAPAPQVLAKPSPRFEQAPARASAATAPAEAAAPAESPAALPAPSPAAEPSPRQDRAADSPGTPAALAQDKRNAASPPASVARWAAASSLLAPLATLQTALVSIEPATTWLREVDALTRGRWQLGPAADLAAADLIGPDGAALGRLAVDERGITWQPRSMAGQAWRAPLPAAAIERLRGELAAWRDLPAAAASAPR